MSNNKRALFAINSVRARFLKKGITVSQKLRGVFACLLLNCLLVNDLQAQTLYKIEVETVAIHQQPSVESNVVHRLYFAENIQLLKIQNKWVKIRFQSQDGEIEGWITKTDLKIQHQTSDDAAIYGVIDSPEDVIPASWDLRKFKVKAISGDIYCNRSKDKKSISGCVVEIDLEIKATDKANAAQVSCDAQLETLAVDGSKKLRVEQKKIRTPLKKGMGAARMQLAVIPLKDKQVKAIKLSSYQCQLTALF